MPKKYYVNIYGTHGRGFVWNAFLSVEAARLRADRLRNNIEFNKGRDIFVKVEEHPATT